MATLNDYKGSVDLVAGLRPISTGYPLIEAHDIQVEEGDIRLDAKLYQLASSIGDINEIASSSGTTTWSRIKALENGLGLITNTPSLNGQTAWSRIRNLENELGLNGNTNDSISTRISNLETKVGNSTDSASALDSASLNARIKKLRSEIGEAASGSTIRAQISDIYSQIGSNSHTGIPTTDLKDSLWQSIIILNAHVGSITDKSTDSNTYAATSVHSRINTLFDRVGSENDQGNSSGSTVWSRIKYIENELGVNSSSNQSIESRVQQLENTVGKSTDAANATGSTTWSRIKATQSSLGSINDHPMPGDVTTHTVWSVAHYARDLGAEALRQLGITYTLNKTNGSYNGTASSTDSTVLATINSLLGTESDSANASGHSAWSRIKAIESNLGKSTDAVSGTSAWSKINNVINKVSTIENQLGSSTDSSGNSIWSKINSVELGIDLLDNYVVTNKLTMDIMNDTTKKYVYVGPKIRFTKNVTSMATQSDIDSTLYVYTGTTSSSFTRGHIYKIIKKPYLTLNSSDEVLSTNNSSGRLHFIIPTYLDFLYKGEEAQLNSSMGLSTDGGSTFQGAQSLKNNKYYRRVSLSDYNLGDTYTYLVLQLSSVNETQYMEINPYDAFNVNLNVSLPSSYTYIEVPTNHIYYYNSSTNKWTVGDEVSATLSYLLKLEQKINNLTDIIIRAFKSHGGAYSTLAYKWSHNLGTKYNYSFYNAGLIDGYYTARSILYNIKTASGNTIHTTDTVFLTVDESIFNNNLGSGTYTGIEIYADLYDESVNIKNTIKITNQSTIVSDFSLLYGYRPWYMQIRVLSKSSFSSSYVSDLASKFNLMWSYHFDAS